MTLEETVNLISRLEQEAARDPHGYRRRVFWLGVLGYVYLGVLFAIIVAILLLFGAMLLRGRYAFLSLKFGLPLLVVLYVLVRSLWVRFSTPLGIEITQARAPEL